MNGKPEHDDGLLTPSFTEEEQKIPSLIRKHLFGEEMTDEEKTYLEQWLSKNDNHPLIFKEATDENNLRQNLRFVEEVDVSQKLQNIKKKLHFNKPRRVIVMQRWAAAAAIVAAISITIFVVLKERNPKDGNNIVVADPVKIAPGIAKAVLTLKNGETILLEQTKDGVIAQQGGSIISKQENRLIYRTIAAPLDSGLYHTITTPRGGNFILQLSDGSLLSMNAGSSVRFPVVFTGNKREVTITGEVFFDIAKNPDMPFIAKVKDRSLEVEVLGTHFNINAYTDEDNIAVTLLEGSVKVRSANHPDVKLSPGQQLKVKEDDSNTSAVPIAPVNVDANAITTWKSGEFKFKDADIKYILRQVEIRYNVRIDYTFLPTTKLTMTLPKGPKELDKVLRIIRKTVAGVNFKTEGQKITATYSGKNE